MRTPLRGILIGWLASALIFIGFPAQAGMVGTEQLLAAETRALNLASVEQFMARQDVQAQFEAWNVTPTFAAERVAALSDAELQELALNIDAEPAGAGAIGVIGVVFLVLLILELVGVTDIFKAI